MHSYGIGWLFCSCGFLYNIFFKTQFWQVNKEKKLLLEGVFTRMLQKFWWNLNHASWQNLLSLTKLVGFRHRLVLYSTVHDWVHVGTWE